MALLIRQKREPKELTVPGLKSSEGSVGSQLVSLVTVTG